MDLDLTKKGVIFIHHRRGAWIEIAAAGNAMVFTAISGEGTAATEDNCSFIFIAISERLTGETGAHRASYYEAKTIL